jgi:hypothetical protein
LDTAPTTFVPWENYSNLCGENQRSADACVWTCQFWWARTKVWSPIGALRVAPPIRYVGNLLCTLETVFGDSQ